jgi:hypothetical protein
MIAGTYVGTDGIRNYKDSDTYVDIKNGVLTAKGADLKTANVSNTLTVGGSANGKILVNNNKGAEIVKIDNTGIYFNGIDQSQTGAGSIIRSDGVYTSLFFQGKVERRTKDDSDDIFGWF